MHPYIRPMEFIKRPLRGLLRSLVHAVPVRGRYRSVDLIGPWIAPPAEVPFRLNGFDILLDHQVRQHRLMYYGLYEENMMNFLKKRIRAGDVVLDPGANIGYVTAHCLGLVGPSGHVHSFEPSPSANAHIRRYNSGTDLPNWSLWDMALTDKEGTQTFYDTPRVMVYGYACLSEAAEPKDRVPHEVQVTTVDAFCAQQDIKRVRFLKLDIEGSEWPALKGASRMIREKAIDIIMIETSMPDNGRAIAQRIDTMLRDAGYRSFHVQRNGEIRPMEVMKEVAFREDVIWMF